MPVNPGDPLHIKASTWNRLEGLANARDVGAIDSLAFAVEQPLLAVKATNSSATTDIDACTPAELKAMDLDPEDVLAARRRPVLEIVPASWFSSLGSLVITLEPIPQGKTGLVAIAGICTAKVDVVSIDHRFATLHPTTVTQLRSCDSGDFALIQPGGSGVRMCQVIAGQREWFWKCQLSENWQSGGTDVKLQSMAGVDLHASATVTMLDPDAMLDDLVLDDIAYCRQKGSKFYAVTAPCET